MKIRILSALWIVAALATPARAGQRDADNPLAAARDLYASARYDEALAMLNGLQPTDRGGSDRKSIEQYRSLCLLALGRGSEAESAIAAVVTADPSYLPGEAEASPRVRAAFSDVRRRLLPDIASSRYTEAKASFDRKDHALAVQQFRQVIALLDDPDTGGKLTDLRTLSAGFLDLGLAALAPTPSAPLPQLAVAPAAPAMPQADPNRIYTMGDTQVSAPGIVRQ